MPSSGKNLTREDWILAALAVLDREGISAVNVESLAGSLGVTKGSFYWHFKNHQDLLDNLLLYWSEHLIEITLEEMAELPDDPSNRLLWLLGRIAEGHLNEHDPAIRFWAAFDTVAAEVVRRVDEERLGFLRNLFLEMGFDDCDAELRCRLSYYYVVGEQIAGLKVTKESRVSHVEPRHALLTELPTYGS